MIHRRLRAGCIAVAALAALAQIGCSASAPTTASYFLSAPLVAAGGGAASGRVEALLHVLVCSLYVEVAGLAADTPYEVTLDGVSVATLVTDANGAGSVNRSVDEHDADPRGRNLAVMDENGVVVLVMAVDDAAYVEVERASLAAFAGGGGSTDLRNVGGERTLAVQLDGVDPGAYDVLIDGLPRAELEAPDGHGSTLVGADDIGPDSSVEVQLGGVGLYVNTPRAQIPGLDWCAAGTQEQGLFSGFSGDDSQARAALTTDVDCGRRFAVTIEDVPMWDYELWVGGVMRGPISVGMDETGAVWGEIAFSSDEHGASALDFDPVGQRIEIRRGDIWYFWRDAFQP